MDGSNPKLQVTVHYCVGKDRGCATALLPQCAMNGTLLRIEYLSKDLPHNQVIELVLSQDIAFLFSSSNQLTNSHCICHCKSSHRGMVYDLVPVNFPESLVNRIQFPRHIDLAASDNMATKYDKEAGQFRNKVQPKRPAPPGSEKIYRHFSLRTLKADITKGHLTQQHYKDAQENQSASNNDLEFKNLTFPKEPRISQDQQRREEDEDGEEMTKDDTCIKGCPCTNCKTCTRK